MISHQTVKDLNLKQYMGKWYEIAKYSFKYQTDCESATANYTYNDADGSVKVVNKCYVNNQSIRTREARAWVPDLSDKGKLKILFSGFPNDGVGDYWVHYYDGENAVVGGPSGQFLWWLSRNPTVKARDVEPMLRIIKSFGYDTDKLMASPGTVVM